MIQYKKPPLSIDDQLALLRGRGMIIADEPDSRHWLQHANYFRLRAYWLSFESNYTPGEAHVFNTGTTFEQVKRLYTFDRKLRLLVLDAIERLEVSLRTCWAHAMAMRHGSHAHLDDTLFNASDKRERCKFELVHELQRSSETFVKHYRQTYLHPQSPPVWAACEVMTLGQLSLWLDTLNARQDRQAVATPYGIDEQLLCSFAHHLSHVRNLCAHHSRLYNRTFTVTVKVPIRPAALGQSVNGMMPKKVYNTLTIAKFLLDVVSPGHSWAERLAALFELFPEVALGTMGFPGDWRVRPVWNN
jgi:abortive infection bacteriophage resistance protein